MVCSPAGFVEEEDGRMGLVVLQFISADGVKGAVLCVGVVFLG